MAFLSTCSGKFLAVTIKNNLRIIDIRTGEVYFKYTNTQSSQETQSISFVCHAFSKDDTIFAALTEDKKILVWVLGETAELQQNIELPKRPTWLTFLQKEKTMLVADKYGDVYKVALTPSAKPVLTLGHLSMVLTVCISDDDSYIITGDRDEKIRVSYHPNAYSIHSYCLGHKKLVSCATVLPNNRLLSTSADKTLKLWNFQDGNELFSFDLSTCVEDKELEFVPSQIVTRGNIVCLIAEKCKMVLLFEILNDRVVHLHSHDATPHQPLSACVDKDTGNFFVVTTNKEMPIIALDKTGKNVVEFENKKINSLLLDIASVLPNDSTYLTLLIKPVRGKRDNSLITPEATIDFEATNKIQKLDTEHNEKKLEE